MSISLKTQKILWGKAAGRCSKPDCRMDLYEDETETDDPTLVGENCHIVADRINGPRGDCDMPVKQRNSYANLILLCRNHHKVIDTQESEYSVAQLHKMKSDHETWVKEQLGFDEEKQRNDVQYAAIVDEWERLAHIDDWTAWSSHALSDGQPYMWKNIDDDLMELRNWLFSRVWPMRYPKLESAFSNFRIVLEAFHEKFREYAEPVRDGERFVTRKFYKINEWDEERYHRLANEYEHHVDLVQDLMLELSRAANLICDQIRNHLMHSYRIKEGHLVVLSGPTKGFSFVRYVPQYHAEERNLEHPYASLEDFVTTRINRDIHFGKGAEP